MVKEILDRLEKDKRLPEMGQIREKQKRQQEILKVWVNGGRNFKRLIDRVKLSYSSH